MSSDSENISSNSKDDDKGSFVGSLESLTSTTSSTSRSKSSRSSIPETSSSTGSPVLANKGGSKGIINSIQFKAEAPSVRNKPTSPDNSSSSVLSSRSDTQRCTKRCLTGQTAKQEKQILPAMACRTPYEAQLPRDKKYETQEKDKRRRKQGKKKSDETRAVSRIVQEKLELYINQEQRENRFHPMGAFRTTKRMHQYDLAYRIREMGSHGCQNKSNNKKEENDGLITPRLLRNSRQVVSENEAKHLADYANEIFSTVPIDALSVIHGYRPHGGAVITSVENGKVQNYTSHVGAALNSHKYIDFYIKEGLNHGNPTKCVRLKKLSNAKGCSSTQQSTNIHCDHQRSQPRDAKSIMNYRNSQKKGETSQIPGNQISFVAQNKDQEKDANEEITKDLADSQYEQENSTSVKKSTESVSAIGNANSCTTPCSDAPKDKQSADVGKMPTEVTQQQNEHNNKCQSTNDLRRPKSSVKGQKATTDEDNVSVHTYVSTEHAQELE